MAYKDKSRQKEAARKHYIANKEKMKIRAQKFTTENRIRLRKLVKIYLSRHSCVDCSESDVVVLDFDHVRGIKRLDISTLVGRSCSVKTIFREIYKCDVRCANCHRRRHANMQVIR